MILLSNRCLITITGDGVADFLNNLITTPINKVVEGGVHAGALLTPQGKIQFEFLISSMAGGYQLETEAAESDALIKRLTMYRLRLPIEIKKPDQVSIFTSQQAGDHGLRDHRFQVEIYRHYGLNLGSEGDHTWYQQALIDYGVASMGVDFALNDVFPHDINFDQIGGMSFSKGCYVGQEVISRMHHKTNVRKRLMIVQAPQGTALETGQSIDIEGKSVGLMGHTHAHQGLAICRIDKISQAMAHNQSIEIGGNSVIILKPKGAEFKFPLAGEEG